MRTKETAALFDAQAARYDAAFDSSHGLARVVPRRTEVALRLIADGPGRLLDAGIGPGRLAAAVAARGWEVWGADVSAEMLGLARARLPDRAEQLVQASIEELPFADGAFDCVAATGVLEHVEELEGALGELARVLRAEGRAILSYPNYRTPISIVRRRALYPAARLVKRVLPIGSPPPPLHANALGRRTFEQALSRAGFGVERLEYVGARAGVGRWAATQLVYAARRD